MFIEKVIRALNKYNVTYAVVGGYAVALHGAIRGTVDIDLLIPFKLVQFPSVERALKSIALSSRLPITAEDVFQYRKEYIDNRNLIAWTFLNPDNPLQIVDIIITHDLDSMALVRKKTANLIIPVISIADLIAMKRRAGRPQDLEDICALEKLI